MKIDNVTARWAEALFRLANRQGALDAVQSDLDRLAGVLGRPGAREWLLAGGPGSSERRSKVLAALGEAHGLVKNFVALVLDRRREEVLLSAAEAFRQRALEERGVVEGVVEVARPLPQVELDGLARALGKSLGKEVRLVARENSELVGGVRVVVGARMLDRSMQGRLEVLRNRLLSARLPAPTR